jgi:hypothetical protein
MDTLDDHDDTNEENVLPPKSDRHDCEEYTLNPKYYFVELRVTANEDIDDEPIPSMSADKDESNRSFVILFFYNYAMKDDCAYANIEHFNSSSKKNTSAKQRSHPIGSFKPLSN